MQNRAGIVIVSLVFTGLMLAAVGTSIAAPGGSPGVTSDRNTTAAEYSPDAQECAFLGLINQYRAQNGKSPLTLLKTLGAAAEHHALDKAQYNDYDELEHVLHDGTTAAQNIANHGYPDSTTGENLASSWSSSLSYEMTAQQAMTQWKNSPPHNTNMLRDTFNAIGIGRADRVESNRRVWFWATTFGGQVTGEPSDCDGNPTPAATATRTATRTATASRTPTRTPTRTVTATRTSTKAATATRTQTATRTATATRTPTKTATTATTVTRTPTKTRTPTRTPTKQVTSTRTPTKTPTKAAATSTKTVTKAATATKTRTPTKAPTATKTVKPTETAIPSRTPRPTRTPRP